MHQMTIINNFLFAPERFISKFRLNSAKNNVLRNIETWTFKIYMVFWCKGINIDGDLTSLLLPLFDGNIENPFNWCLYLCEAIFIRFKNS